MQQNNHNYCIQSYANDVYNLWKNEVFISRYYTTKNAHWECKDKIEHQNEHHNLGVA